MSESSLNTWINASLIVSGGVTKSTCMSFVFYNIRCPAHAVEVDLGNVGGKPGETLKIPKNHASLILGYEADYFTLITFRSPLLDGARVNAYGDYMKYPESQLAYWKLYANNLVGGNSPWEVFNGPNPVIIRSEKASQ